MGTIMYLKRSKNDDNDAAEICEAVTRPSMRYVTSARCDLSPQSTRPITRPTRRETATAQLLLPSKLGRSGLRQS
jgi:transposase